MLKRFTASYDTTITNAYKANLTTRGTGSNMGGSDVLETFSIYGQQSTSSSELSRILLQFPISDVSSSRASGSIPASGSASFYLRAFNARHGQTLPYNYTLSVLPVSRSWSEGSGIDMEDYSDYDYCNWIYASSGSAWTSEGGDFHSTPHYTASIVDGDEDLEINITDLVEQWIAGTKQNYGVVIKLSSSYESASTSYYTKRFFGKTSEYFFKRPILEVRWNDAKKDSRASFYASSSLLGSENVQTLYFYNYHKGVLRNIPTVGTGAIYVQLFTSASGGTSISSVITGGYSTTGIYIASFALDTTASSFYDRWYSSGLTTCFHTGSEVLVKTVNPNDWNTGEKYVTKITNLKPTYRNTESTRFRVFTRKRNWQVNSWTSYTTDIKPDIVEDAYWSIVRVDDNTECVSFGTSSDQHTKLSYDLSGSYFDFDMNYLQPNFSYRIRLAYYIDGNYEIQPEIFKFKVVEN